MIVHIKKISRVKKSRECLVIGIVVYDKCTVEKVPERKQSQHERPPIDVEKSVERCFPMSASTVYHSSYPVCQLGWRNVFVWGRRLHIILFHVIFSLTIFVKYDVELQLKSVLSRSNLCPVLVGMSTQSRFEVLAVGSSRTRALLLSCNSSTPVTLHHKEVNAYRERKNALVSMFRHRFQ